MDNARTMRGAKRLQHLPGNLEAALQGSARLSHSCKVSPSTSSVTR